MPLCIAVMRLAANGQMLPRQVLTYQTIAGGAQSTPLTDDMQNVTVKVTNTETAAGRVAWGTNADATATAATGATTAAMPIGAGESEYLHLMPGERLSFATSV